MTFFLFFCSSLAAKGEGVEPKACIDFACAMEAGFFFLVFSCVCVCFFFGSLNNHNVYSLALGLHLSVVAMGFPVFGVGFELSDVGSRMSMLASYWIVLHGNEMKSMRCVLLTYPPIPLESYSFDTESRFCLVS